MDLTLALSKIFLLSLPFQFAISPVSGFDVHVSRVFSIVIFLVWIAESLLGKRCYLTFRAPALALLFFLGISSASVLWANDWVAAVRRLSFLFSYAPLFFVFSSLLESYREKAEKALLSAFVYGAFFSAVMAIIWFLAQFFFGIDKTLSLIFSIHPFFLGEGFAQAVSEYPSILVNIGGETMLRASGLFPDPHMAGFYFGISIPIALGLVIASDKSREIYRFSFMAAAIFFADMATFSRGAYLGIFFTFFVAAAVFMLRGRKVYRFSMIAIFLCLTFFIVSDTPVRSRLLETFSFQEGSNQGRIVMWEEAISRIQEQPFGYGLANYPLVVKSTASDREPIYAHNLFLDIATESGLLGSIAFLVLLGTSFARLFSRKEAVSLSCSGSLLVFFVHSLVETPLYSVHVFPALLLIISCSHLNNSYIPENSMKHHDPQDV